MILLLIAVLIIILILYMRVNIRVTYLKDGTDDELIFIISTLMGLLNIKREINVVDLVLSNKKLALELKEEIEVTRKGMLLKELERVLDYQKILDITERVKELMQMYKNAILYFKNKIIIRYLNWETGIGTGDAALTGIATGFLWNVKTIIVYVLNTQFRIVDVPSVNIKPNFERIAFITQFDCIFSFKIGHAIIAGIKGLIAKRRMVIK